MLTRSSEQPEQSAGGEPETGPAQLVLLAAVARRHYLDGRSKVEIADELQLSRFRVARLLERAVATGLVRIEIGGPGDLDLTASSRLQDAYGLQHALVLGGDGTGAASGSAAAGNDVRRGAVLRARLGAAAAELVTEIVTPQDVLGLSWARAVSAMATAVSGLAAVPVVQLTGSLAGHALTDSTVDTTVELVRALSRMSGGPAYFYYVPMLVPDPSTAAALRGQPEVARAFSRFRTVTKAVAGIGQWSAGESMLYEAVTPAERRTLHRLGVCAEVSGVLLTEDGEPVQTELTERMIAISVDELRGVGEVIGIPYGVRKTRAVRAALRSGLVTSLVTDAALAASLLEPA